MTTWSKVRWSEANQVLSLLDTAQAEGGPDASGSPEAYFAGLRAAHRRADAADFLAQALPRLEAVAWAAQTVRDAAPQPPNSRPEARALRAALFWVQDPTEPRRRAAHDAALACDPLGPEALAAFAAFFSGGSIAPPDLEPVPAPKHAAGRFAAGAVKMSTLALDKTGAALDRALDAGEALARSGLKGDRMTLVLTLENVDRLENGEPTTLRLDRHGAVIGRSPHSDWSLPDAKNYVSSTHCEIDYRDGAYLLIDRSTNGTFVNDGAQRLPAPHPLRDGDVILIGQYRVGVRGGGSAPAPSPAVGAPPPAAAASGGAWGGWNAAPAGGAAAAAAPSSGGWEAPAAPASGGWDAPAAPASAKPGGGWSSSAAEEPVPASGGWAPTPSPAKPSGGWDTPTSSAGWEAPAAAEPAGWGAPAAPASGGWDDAPAPAGGASSWGAPASASPAMAQPAAPASSPATDSVWGAAGAGPAKAAASGWDALSPARDAAAAAGAPGGFEGATPPVSGRGALSQAWAAPRVASPEPTPPTDGPDVWGAMAASNAVDWGRGGFGAAEGGWSAPPPPAIATAGPTEAAIAPTSSPTPPSAAGADAAWRAFLQAAALPDGALKAEPAQAAAAAGSMLRRMVAGLVVMMEARARAKAQLGAQSTTLELKGNNPIKFARSPERVLAQLLNTPERGFMGADDAVEDSFRDLQAHQMATLAAMQGALRSTLDRFSPASIRQRAETRGLLAKILPSARDAAMWQAYEREFEGVAKGSDEAFMDVFAKAFKAAYEQAAAQMKGGR